MAEKRKITIDTRGPIRQKGGIVGPIRTPYLEEVGVISRMILGGVKVTEHLENGEKKQLTSKDLKDLNANVKVIRENKVQQADRSRIEQLAQAEKDRLAAEREAKLASVKKEEQTPVVEQPQQGKLSKKERRELQRQQATEASKAPEPVDQSSNEKQEDDIEVK